VTSTNVAPVSRRNPQGPLVILGASYAAGWQPALQRIEVLNRGIEGQQSWELLARFDRDVVQARPRAVVIWGFINDVFRAPRGAMGDAEKRVRDAMTRMVTLARENGIEPILATEVTIRGDDSWFDTARSFAGRVLGRTSYQDYINKHVQATNEWLRAFARRERVLLLDLEAVLSGPDGVRRSAYAAEDGSHISPEGYGALTAYAAPVLDRHLRETRTFEDTGSATRHRVRFTDGGLPPRPVRVSDLHRRAWVFSRSIRN
jgi:lysophospholipase L1-like esterase